MRTKVGKFLVGLVLAAMICLPSMGSATPINLQETGVDYSAVVNIGGAIPNTSVYAGLYQLLIQNPSGSGPFNHFDAYCVDPQFSPTGTVLYDLTPIVASQTRLAAAAWVLDKGYTTTAPLAQVAVWELTWDTGLFNLGAGSFILNSGLTDGQKLSVEGIYDAALTAVAAGFNPVNFSLAHNGSNQDYIVNNPVPVPPSALLLGSGLFGLILLKKGPWLQRRQTA